MTSPFRTTAQLGPNLWQVVRTGAVWYDSKQIASPQLGDVEFGDDGHMYIWVEASGAIAAAAAPGTVIVVTEPGYTAATGAGAFNAPNSTNVPVALAAGDRFWARKTAL